MKKIISVLILFTSLFLISCADEDSNNLNVTETGLVGTWKVIDLHTKNGKITGTSKGVTRSATYSLKGKDYNMNMTFAENPKIVTSKGSMKITSTFTSDKGESRSQETLAKAIISPGKWSLNNNILTVKNETGASSSMSIVSFNGNSITFKQSLNKFNINIEDNNLEMSGEIFLTLSK